MEKSPVIWLIGQISWLLTALASINIGLKYLGMAFMLPIWAKYVIGGAGLVGLYLIMMALLGIKK